ncbi:MAG: LacI family DNA-binding transcriptional regulator [Anaerolineales bacterium]
MTKKRVTIQDVAAAVGVSRQTVSRVINSKGDVAEETRQRVLKVIDSLGYRPNLAARGLTNHRTHTMGLVIPYTPDYFFYDPHLMAFMCGVDQVAIQRDYNLLLSTAPQDPSDPRGSQSELLAYERLVQAGYVDGVVVVELLSSRRGIQLLEEYEIPWVALGYGVGTDPTRAVHADDRGGARQAMLYLLGLGHERIGIISHHGQSLTAIEERLDGCRQALADHRLEIDPELIVSGDLTLESGIEATEQLLSSAGPPTAIFALNDRMALGALQCLQSHGRRVPEEVSVVGFDDVPIARIYHPALTTVRQPSLEMGHQAARLLFDFIENQAVLSQPMILPTELIVRASTGPAPAE